MRCSAVQVTGGQPPQAAIAKGVVLKVFKNAQVNTLRFEQFICLFQNASTIKVIKDHAAN